MVDNWLIPGRGGSCMVRPYASVSCAEPATRVRSRSYRTREEPGPSLSSEAPLASRGYEAGLCGMREKQMVGSPKVRVLRGGTAGVGRCTIEA